ncbi:MAG: VirB4-like conjugal transfer ATPase, CD1110 family [Candidatus Nanogingivalis sp.]|jgi:type IV secretory pathway virB4 protein-like protein
MAKKKDAVDIAAQQRAQEQAEVEQAFLTGINTLRDLIAPSSLEFHSGYFRLGTKYGQTIYVYGYPRQLYTGWASPILNADEVLDVSMFIYPVETEIVMKNLRRKVTQLEADLSINNEKGRTRDPALEAALNDAEELRDQLQLGAEKFFRFGLYLTIYADSLDELNFVRSKVETMLGQQMLFSKVASSQQEQGLKSTVPQLSDQLQIRRNMNTGAISTSFPFTSADLTQENGVLYGVNMHNNGLVIFDRYTLENANMVVFAKSGAGKSFTVKLEALRTMMMGAEVLIIDPENEYQKLSDAVGGSYIRLSLNSDVRINPFDLPHVIDAEEADNALRANIVTLHGLFRLMLGGTSAGQSIGLSPNEEADLDQAIIDTYARAGITSDPLTHNSTPPTIHNLYDTLVHMDGSGPSLAQRLRKYTTGTFAGIFSQQSNIDINNSMVVFNIRDLEDELRPVAMYIVLSHIWNIVRSEQKKRMLIVDEAWQLMKYDDSANFLFSLAKRARKYYLGLTTISQDVEDFMGSKMGRAIVSNSSMQLLLKQSSSAVDVLSDVFKLTEEERKRLSNFPVGQGLFFAGQNHVHIQIIASDTEHQLISTSPNSSKNRQGDNMMTNGYTDPNELF